MSPYTFLSRNMDPLLIFANSGPVRICFIGLQYSQHTSPFVPQKTGAQTSKMPISQRTCLGLWGAFATNLPHRVSIEDFMLSPNGPTATLIINRNGKKVCPETYFHSTFWGTGGPGWRHVPHMGALVRRAMKNPYNVNK